MSFCIHEVGSISSIGKKIILGVGKLLDGVPLAFQIIEGSFDLGTLFGLIVLGSESLIDLLVDAAAEQRISDVNC